jgi:hypothetical protein
VTPAGDVWATVGGGGQRKSLIKRSADGRYQIAIVHNGVRFSGALLEGDGNHDNFTVSAVSMGVNGNLLLAGDTGIYSFKDQQLRRLVAFENINRELAINEHKWHGCVGDILPLGDGRFLIAGVFGGMYLIERVADHHYSATSVGETIDKPVTF